MEHTNYNDIQRLLLKLFLENPAECEEVAKRFGLWDWLFQAIAHRIHMQACRRDINLFLEYIMTDPETGEDIIQQPFHQEWQLFHLQI